MNVPKKKKRVYDMNKGEFDMLNKNNQHKIICLVFVLNISN